MGVSIYGNDNINRRSLYQTIVNIDNNFKVA